MLVDKDKVYCVIDYLALLCSRRKAFDSRQEELTSILESINQFITEYNVHFLINITSLIISVETMVNPYITYERGYFYTLNAQHQDVKDNPSHNMIVWMITKEE